MLSRKHSSLLRKSTMTVLYPANVFYELFVCLSLESRLFNSVFGGLFVFLQVQSFTEYFQSDCTDSIAWLNGPNYFTAITEGWAAYNEYELFPNYTTLYNWDSNQQGHKDIMKQKYGMLYYQVLETVII